MLQYLQINILFPALTAILVYVFLNASFHIKTSKKRLLLFVTLFATGNAAISTLWIRLFDMSDVIQMLKPVFILIFSVLVIKNIFKVDWLKSVSSFLLIMVTFGMGNLISPILMKIFGFNLTTKTIALNAFLYFVSNMATFAIALVLVIITPRLIIFGKVKNLNFLLVLFFVTLVIMIIITQTLGSNSNILVFAILVIILIVLYVFLFLGYNKQQKQKDQEEEKRQQEFYNNSLKDTLQELRRFKHDQNNHNDVLSFMLEKGRLDDAIKYLGEIQSHINNTNTAIYNIENVALHAIISSKMGKAEQSGVDFDFTAVGVTDTIPEIKVSELCEIIGIYLDNAIEAAQETQEKKIEMQIISYQNLIEIKLSNSCKEKPNFENIRLDGYSTKGDDRGHGLAIAEQILKRYKNIANEVSFFDTFMRYEQNIKIKKTPM